MAAFAPGITAQNPPDRLNPALYKAMFFNRVNRVLRTTGLKAAIAVGKHIFKKAVVKRKSSLVNPY